MTEIRQQVSRLTNSVLGDLEGKQGLITLLQQTNELSRRNSEQLARQSSMIDALRLDRAKVAGICIAVASVMGILYRVFLK